MVKRWPWANILSAPVTALKTLATKDAANCSLSLDSYSLKDCSEEEMSALVNFNLLSGSDM